MGLFVFFFLNNVGGIVEADCCWPNSHPENVQIRQVWVQKSKKKKKKIQHKVTSQQESKFQSWNEMAEDDGGVEVRRL